MFNNKKKKRALEAQVKMLKGKLAWAHEQIDNCGATIGQMNGQLKKWREQEAESMLSLAAAVGDNPRDLAELHTSIRKLRTKAAHYDAFVNMVDGKYDANAALLARLRAALGMSVGDTKDVINRASQAVGLIAQNSMLRRKLDDD